MIHHMMYNLICKIIYDIIYHIIYNIIYDGIYDVMYDVIVYAIYIIVNNTKGTQIVSKSFLAVRRLLSFLIGWFTRAIRRRD